MDATTETGSIPSAMPTNKETIIKVIKGFNLKRVIKIKRSTIPNITISRGIKRFSLVDG
jgi:hypothetical protein